MERVEEGLGGGQSLSQPHDHLNRQRASHILSPQSMTHSFGNPQHFPGCSLHIYYPWMIFFNNHPAILTDRKPKERLGP